MAVDPQLKASVVALFGPGFRVSQEYWTKHDGVDIAAKSGTPLHAIAGGTVSYARNEANDPEDPKRHWALGGGNVVNIDIGGNRTLQYAHLLSIDVNEGDRVTAGQVIGKVGKTGHATGSHVHFGLWDHKTNKMVKPYAYFASLVAGGGQSLFAPLPPAKLIVVEQFAQPRRFRVRPGSHVRAFHPAQPNQIVKQHDFPTGSGASALAFVRILWPGQDPQPVPHGVFLKVADGMFEGLYIVPSEVDLEPVTG
jgi:murein DD-endopeptidase MepM/ murein hydrolase activator NlpD